MTKVIPVINNKGGVAKTITSVTTASILAQRGYKTLLLDLDQQGNATSAVGVKPTKEMLTIYDIFFEDAGIDEVAVNTPFENLELIPATGSFVSALSKLLVETIPDKDNILKRAINRSQKDYDFIIIDCPPALDQIISNALMASTNIVIPTSPDKFSTDGIQRIVKFITKYIPYMEHFTGYGVLITKHEKRRSVVDGIVASLRSLDFLNVYDAMIAKSTAVDQSTFVGIPINHYQANSQTAIGYRAFVDELLERIN